MSAPATVDGDLVAALRGAGLSDVDGSGLARALYSSDASLYRVLPRAVVRPRDADEIVATLEVCRSLGVPLTARGAGTSIAGNAVGPGVVLDTSRHLNRVLGIDADARTAVVEPGLVQAALQTRGEAVRPALRPRPEHAQPLHRRRDDRQQRLRLARAGLRPDVGQRGRPRRRHRLRRAAAARQRPRPRLPASSATCTRLVEGELATIRTELGRFGRQVSGYSLEHLLPERGFDVARALVGSEGTLALVLGATVRLVADAPYRGLVVLGYPTMADAADATPALLPHSPTAVEGMDARIVQRLRDVPAAVVPDLPRGEGWLIVELTGDSVAEVTAKAHGVLADAGALDSLVVTDVAEAAALWRIREDGAGLAARTSDGRPAHAGWEDAAVPVEKLGAYLRDFEALLDTHGLQGLPYGHFGDGCVHVRIDFPFGSGEDRGRPRYRAFVEDAARLVAGHGGSMSGEHGDGRARSELLSYMYSPEVLRLFEQVKAVFDPDDLLNPGVLVRPARLDDDIRVAAVAPRRERLALAYRHDGGDFAAAVHRCTGVGKCRADLSASGGVMCPSWGATREEKDTTRGRARVLQEMLAPGGPVRDWRSPEVHEALDLCLSCKGCSRDCPTGVDMASYKAEVLHQSYRRRLRPRAHYTLGRLPRWADLAARTPRLVNAVLASRLGGRLAKWSAGMDQRRDVPPFALRTFRQEWGRTWPLRP